jgi:DNA-directed RNA polymerase subunit K/omega
MKKYESRGPELDLDKAVELSGGNRFHLIIEASARARQIRRTNQSSDRFEHTHPCMTALLEYQEGTQKK